MIRALEGVNFVGKSTATNLLSVEFGFPVYSDPGRHGLFEDWLVPFSPREWQVQGTQNALASTVFSNWVDVILDRWILSNLVHDEERGLKIPDRVIWKILELTDNARVYLLHADLSVVLERAEERGVVVTDSLRDTIFKRAEAFLRWATVLDSYYGVEVYLVNANWSSGEVFDAIYRNW